MGFEGQKCYPGENATPEQVAILAIEYHRAAEVLLKAGRRGEALSWAPYRWTALHAVELYLNAFLLAAGASPNKLRGLQHDLGSRAQQAHSAQLRLRKRTMEHLVNVSENREYLVSRYDAGEYAASQLNRLRATLLDVAKKVTIAIDAATGPHSK